MSPGDTEAKAFGPYAFTLTPAEADAAAARFGLRLALAGGLTARHHAPLAAFVLALLFASILAFTGLISRRAGEIAILLSAAAFMIQRLATHWRLQTARTRGKSALAQSQRPLTVAIDETGVTVEGAARPMRAQYGELMEAEDTGELVYLWPRAGEPIILPTRALGEGEAPRLVAEAKRRIAAAKA
jgi:hypothetical protein